MQKMDIGCGPYKKLMDNFHQCESPYTLYVKVSKTTQDSTQAMSDGNSMKMLYII